ncbi:FtsX-like permease family protein, partial [Dactylosporangium sp. NPDC005555]|uniref:FtsX-like permease family protein n=1 Tax=Dactylosporangium sp. NPDC005555 TaxID=3154889 RepID=UPI00339EAD0D
MLRLVLGALRARTAQAWTVFTLAVLLVTAATAGPWYAAAAERRATAADVAVAPAAQRMLSVRRQTDTDGDAAVALATFRAGVERLLTVRDEAPVLGMSVSMTFGKGGTSSVVAAYRDGACDHMRIEGACPRAAGETVVSGDTADAFGLHIGDTVVLSSQPGAPQEQVRVVGRYELVDPAGLYWANPLFRRDAAGNIDPFFLAVDAFASSRFVDPTFDYTTAVPERALAGAGLAEQLRRAEYTLRGAGYYLIAPTQDLLDRIAADRAAIRRGVLAGALQAVVLCWFALGLAGRHTSGDRRGDVALLKLRGSTRRRMLRLAAGQHLVPLLAAAPAGFGLGWLLAYGLAGAPPAADRGGVLQTSLAAAGAALLGAAVAVLSAEVPVLRAPVAVLLREVPGRRRGWRRGALDAVLVILAAVGAFQLGRNGFAAAVPVLVAVVLAVPLARLLGAAADRAGAGALRRGRLRLGLTAVQVSRRPGADRVFALVAVAVAGLTAATAAQVTGDTARADRSGQELGAARVLTVRVANPTTLLRAVREADPGGRYAMAVVVDDTTRPRVLAVDASRLAAVARWRTEYGPLPSLAAPAVGDRAPATVGAGPLVLRARGAGEGGVTLAVHLQDTADGSLSTVTLGPVPAGAHEVTAGVEGCAAGCRVTRLDLVKAGAGDALTVEALRQGDRAVFDSATLGDPRLWRAPAKGLAVSVVARQGTLTLAQAPAVYRGDSVAYPIATGLPLPVVVAGEVPEGWRLGDPAVDVFGSGAVPVRVAGTTGVLPAVGTAGILLDLDAAERLGTGGAAGRTEVWLADGAPASVVAALAAAGLVVLGDDTATARAARLAGQGPAVATRLQLVTAALGVLAAAAA